MAGKPNWTADPTAPIPTEYLSLAAEWGDRIRSGDLTQAQFAEATGSGSSRTETLWAYVTGRTCHPAPGVDSPPAAAWSTRETPEVDRWDSDPPADSDFADRWDEDAEDIDTLIRQRVDVYRRVRAQHRKRKHRTVTIEQPGPIAIAHLGDPHVDDDGCDWPALLRTVETVGRTPGMYAGNVGDVTNNWIGRLQAQYAHQSSTLEDATRLASWLLRSMPHLYLVLGNHDVWHNGSHLLRSIMRGAKCAVLAEAGARMELRFPRGEPIRIVARHDFPGTSQWNRAHGPMKAAKMDSWGHVYVQGHRHMWAVHQEEGADGVHRTALMVRGYKRCDSYADSKGYQEHEHGEVITTILQPTHAHPCERVKVYHDIEEAADVLGYLRRRAGVR